MKKAHQNAIFWTFCLVFLVLGPVILLHTAGYRLALNNQRLRQTGALDIETWPRNANLLWNEQATSEVSPTVLNNLFPGQGLLTITKAGYQPFSQTIDIQAGRTTYVDAPLFLATQSESINAPTPAPAAEPAHAPLFQSDGVTVAVRLADNREPIAWLPNDAYRLIYTDPNTLIVAGDRQGGFLIALSPSRIFELPLSPTDVAPETGRSPERFLITNGQEVQLFNTTEARSTLITRQTPLVNDIAWLPRGFGYLVADTEGLTAYTKDIFAEGRAYTRLLSGQNIQTLMVTETADSLDYQTVDGAWYRLPLF
jgi:hypothetical protein